MSIGTLWEFKRVWRLEPSKTDPETVFAGIEEAALFRSTDGGDSWHELAGLRNHPSGPGWHPGAGGLCLHTVMIDDQDPNRMFVAISAAGAFRTRDGGNPGKMNADCISALLEVRYTFLPTAETICPRLSKTCRPSCRLKCKP